MGAGQTELGLPILMAMGQPLPVLRTRLAPTPSGYLHLGNIFNFLLTWELVQRWRAAGGEAILRLRMDDLDQQRFRPAYAAFVFQVLHHLNITLDAGPMSEAELPAHSQLTRLDRYNSCLNSLAAAGLVYACSCSRTALTTWKPTTGAVAYACPCFQESDHHLATSQDALSQPDVSWRLLPTTWQLVPLNGEQLPAWTGLPPVLRRRDGVPAYHIATLCDDVNHQTTHIIRGQDLLESTCTQLLLAQLLVQQGLDEFSAFTAIRFYHHALLLADATGAKLSKSAGSNATASLPTAAELTHLRDTILRL